MGVPFVVCASTNHLNNIHKFGFKTFGSLIDESYDSDLDYVGKIPKIIDSGLELAKLTNTEEVESIVEFNKSLYFDENHTKMVAKTMFLDEIVKINTQISALI